MKGNTLKNFFKYLGITLTVLGTGYAFWYFFMRKPIFYPSAAAQALSPTYTPPPPGSLLGQFSGLFS